MFQFHSYSHRFARFKETRPASYAKGPAFACIAWIPFAKSVAALPPCEYQKHEYARKFLRTKSVFDLVFRSGNRTPAAKFGSREKFLTSLDAKDFRGALAIDNVSAALSAEGEFMGVDFDYFAEAGFTPFRLQPESKVSYFCPGAKDSNFALSSVPNQDLTVELWVCFKLGKFPDFLNYAMTGTKAPSAILRIDYSLKSTQAVKIDVAGSDIPSQIHYRSWVEGTAYHNMLNISTSEIDGFLNAGECANAPISVKGHVETSWLPVSNPEEPVEVQPSGVKLF